MSRNTLMAESTMSRQVDPRQLWYVPDRRLRTPAAAKQALQVVRWIMSGNGLPQPPTEEVLFVAMHVCAFRAARRARGSEISERERKEWAGHWETVREHIINRNLGLVYSMIGRFGTRTVDEDDLLSDALLALTRACDRFNPWRGYRFSTYACNVIARALMRRGKRESNYRRLFPVQHDATFERATGTPDRQSELYVERLRIALDQNLGELTEIETHILTQRFPETRDRKLTFQEIGDAIGLSKERVRQIQNTALGKLREVLVADPVLQ